MTSVNDGDGYGSLSQEEEEANLRTMRTIHSFEDVYRTYKAPEATPILEYKNPPINSIFKNKCSMSITTYEKSNPSSTTTLKSQDRFFSESPSTLIAMQVRSKIRKLNQKSLEVSGCKAVPKDLKNCRNVNQSYFRIASGQIANKSNPDYNYYCSSGTEYPNNAEVGANYMPVSQSMGYCPANYTGYYDQSREQNSFRYCTYNQEPYTKQDSGQQIDYCCCSYGSNESTIEDSSSQTTKQGQSLNEAQGRGESSYSYRKKNNKLNERQSDVDSNVSECSSETYCVCNYDQDTDERTGCCCERGLLSTNKNDTKDDCSCSPLSSPTKREQNFLPSFLMRGSGPPASNYCPPTSDCYPPTSDYYPPTSNSCPPTSDYYSPTSNSCQPHSSSGGPPANFNTNCVDIESFLSRLKQANEPCTPNCLTQPSPPCLGMGTDDTTSPGMGFWNLNRYSAPNNNKHGNIGNPGNSTRQMNDVLQSHTVYSRDYQPIMYGGNNFNHFPNPFSGAGSESIGCRCFGSGGTRIAGAGTPSSETYEDNSYYPGEQTVCGGGSALNAGCGLCGDLCGGQSNGIYGIGNLCCDNNTQNCYPLSQLSPGYCNNFPTGCCMPCSSSNCSPYEMVSIMPYSYGCPCEMPESNGAQGGMNRCCSRATSCNLSQSSFE